MHSPIDAAKQACVLLKTSLLNWLHPSPKVIEHDAVEERFRLDDFSFSHVEKPCVGIRVRLAVTCDTVRVKMHDYRSLFFVQVLDFRLQPNAHPSIEWSNYLF